MSDERWIIIPNWERFQHPDATRSENIPWIRNYTRLMRDDNYLDLTEHQALILHRLWLTYASARRHLRLNTSSLSRHLHVRVMTRDLEALNHAGFIEFVQADRKQGRARTRDENRKEETKAVKAVRVERPVENFSEQEQEQNGADPDAVEQLSRELAERLGEPW